MNVVLTLCWYDEPPEWLYEAVKSVKGLCDHVLAVDGAYALYPDGKGRSHPAQAAAVTFAALESNLGLTIHQPSSPWPGNEVEKRDRTYRMADLLGADWILVMDGDEYVKEAPEDTREKLAATDERTVVVAHDLGDRPLGWCQKLYRTPVRVGRWHGEYLGPNGELLAEDENCRVWWPDLVLYHRRSDRTPERRAAADEYYRLRDDQGLEPR